MTKGDYFLCQNVKSDGIEVSVTFIVYCYQILCDGQVFL